MEFTLFYRYPVDMIWSVGPTSPNREDIRKAKVEFFGENYRKIGYLLRVLVFHSDTKRSKQSFAREMNRREGILKRVKDGEVHFQRCDENITIKEKRKIARDRIKSSRRND